MLTDGHSTSHDLSVNTTEELQVTIVVVADQITRVVKLLGFIFERISDKPVENYSQCTDVNWSSVYSQIEGSYSQCIATRCDAQ